MHNCVHCDSCVHGKASDFYGGETPFSMAEDKDQELTRWNLRPFPVDIKRECNVRAAVEGKKDWKWLADYLRKVLPMVETSEVDSIHEDRQGTIRRSSPPDAAKAPAESLRHTRKKRT